MQCALKFRKPIHGLMVCEKYIGVVVAENPNPQFLDSRHSMKQSQNGNRNIHLSRVNQKVPLSALKKWNPNLVDKYMKQKKKKEETKVYEIWPNITVKQLAGVLKIDAEDAYEIVLSSGYGNNVPNLNSPIVDHQIFKHFRKVLECKFKIETNTVVQEEVNLDVQRVPINFKDLVPRPPVVALVGHIDHGKTTLLDRLRSSSVVDTECGGITQHIGTFSLNLGENQKMTFLDTPGHAAFKSMRIRGTNITDIVILVVDAVEGPLEQTIESLRAIRQSQCNMIVAINKIDRPDANVENTKKSFARKWCTI